ncbi:hypothetical protein SUGI_0884740 [Cryptomeria japonica]|uniref:uncharacterized protein LOC131061458 n=1 Tax=Cryptomeria japonica TaxID=3369 RepID=UPI002414CDE7|nr:uncharacterized protein LOC131061458 [Cryptomeria japonica]GLJ42675.1 hypothetical protein SUGI_0884740 [Cryptomeria japonica]
MADTSSGSFGDWRHRASHFYLLLIFFSFPLFSVPCPKGLCSTPVEVVTVHLVSKGINDAIAKALLYPGALFTKLESIVAENEPISLPDWDTLLDNITASLKDKEQNDRTFGLGLIIGSYLCLAGAIACVLGPTPLSAFGPLLILWSIYYEGGDLKDCYALPMFSVAVFCALSGISLSAKVPRGTNHSATSGDSLSNDEKSKPSSSNKKTK